MTTLAAAVQSVSTPLIQRGVRRRLAAVDGAHHIPTEGAFILAPNHTSYYDHFVTGTVLLAVRDQPAWFLTKSEAFDRRLSRFWHTVMRCLPVDRGRPTSTNLARIGEVLAAGNALVVYPEGTRGPGADLLSFKNGAFWFAVRYGVPVIPAGLAGTSDVLPKGTSWIHRRPVRIAFGAPLLDDQSLPRSQRVKALLRQAEEQIPELVRQAAGPPAGSVGRLAREVSRQIDASLQPDGRCPAPALRRLGEVARLIQDQGGDDLDLAVQRLRLRGLRATSAGPVRRLLLGYPVRRRGLRLLRRDPGHPMANYLVGRWYLSMPRVLGGRPALGAQHFARAVIDAPPEDTRYSMALAEALVADGRPAEAVPPLRAVLTHSGPGERTDRRRERARTMLTEIEPPQPKAEVPSTVGDSA